LAGRFLSPRRALGGYGPASSAQRFCSVPLSVLEVTFPLASTSRMVCPLKMVPNRVERTWPPPMMKAPAGVVKLRTNPMIALQHQLPDVFPDDETDRYWRSRMAKKAIVHDKRRIVRDATDDGRKMSGGDSDGLLADCSASDPLLSGYCRRCTDGEKSPLISFWGSYEMLC
jgi:hypothetical protein